MHYHVGQNVPGYSPMADEPTILATWEDAKACMIDDLDRVGDHIFETGEADEDAETRAIADEYSATMEDLNLSSGPEWGVILPTSTSDHDLGLSFWITPCNDPECEDDES